MKQPEFFNPLSFTALSESLERALMRSELYPMTTVQDESFPGYGIYALFYQGDFPAYHRLSEQNRKNPGSWPIYIGVSSPKTQKGTQWKAEDVDNIQTNLKGGLSERVKHHAKSISEATNLDINDFQCKLLTLSFIWAPVAESAMIAAYEPIWNSYLRGFGNHSQGKGRDNGKQTLWDTLHPGRKMNGIKNSKSADDLAKEVEQVLEITWIQKFRQ